MDWFEDSVTQSIITITSNGEVGRPQFHVKFPNVLRQL